jgi:hypothetical protein
MAKEHKAAGTGELIAVREHMRGVLFDDAGVERPIQPQSRLAQEADVVSARRRPTLPRRASQALHDADGRRADGLGSLARLDGSLPFGAVVVVRGLLETAAELYWLSASDIDAAERTRRTFTSSCASRRPSSVSSWSTPSASLRTRRRS